VSLRAGFGIVAPGADVAVVNTDLAHPRLIILADMGNEPD
jgi:hypothetical protein